MPYTDPPTPPYGTPAPAQYAPSPRPPRPRRDYRRWLPAALLAVLLLALGIGVYYAFSAPSGGRRAGSPPTSSAPEEAPVPASPAPPVGEVGPGPDQEQGTGDDAAPGPDHEAVTPDDVGPGPDRAVGTPDDVLAGPDGTVGTGDDVGAGPDGQMGTGDDTTAGTDGRTGTADDVPAPGAGAALAGVPAPPLPPPAAGVALAPPAVIAPNGGPVDPGDLVGDPPIPADEAGDRGAALPAPQLNPPPPPPPRQPEPGEVPADPAAPTEVPLVVAPPGELGPGAWLVGRDFTPGRWATDGARQPGLPCYVEVFAAGPADGVFGSSLLKKLVPSDRVEITIPPDARYLVTTGCGNWRKIDG